MIISNYHQASSIIMLQSGGNAAGILLRHWATPAAAGAAAAGWSQAGWEAATGPQVARTPPMAQAAWRPPAAAAAAAAPAPAARRETGCATAAGPQVARTPTLAWATQQLQAAAEPAPVRALLTAAPGAGHPAASGGTTGCGFCRRALCALPVLRLLGHPVPDQQRIAFQNRQTRHVREHGKFRSIGSQ